MPAVESVVSPFPPGSARKMDYTFPDWNVQGAGGPSNQERDRPGAQGANPSGSSSAGATGTIVAGVVNGISAIRLINGANLNGGPAFIADGMGRLHFNTLAANTKCTTNTDDYGCTRVYMLAAVVATPGDATDCGLQIILGTNAGSSILAGSKPGVGIQFDNTGGCSYIQHGNSGAQTATVLQSAAGGFVNTNPHKFEFRIINASPTANGFIKVYLDDHLMLTKSFGSVPDDLPLPTSPGANANNGYVVNVQQQSRNTELDVFMVRVQRGPTEQAVIS